MIEFIIISKNAKKIQGIIDKSLMHYDYNYTKKEYNSQNCILDNDNYKIYIIEYETEISKIIQRIRYRYNDWKSMIIVITNNPLEKERILKEDLMILTTIIKDHNLEKNIINSIVKALHNYEWHPNTLKFTHKNINYIVDLKDILYIEKIKDSKKCRINMKRDSIEIQGNLNELLKKLDNRFIKCSRSYIINIEQVKSYNKKDNIIMLRGSKEINEISRNKKMELLNLLRKVE